MAADHPPLEDRSAGPARRLAVRVTPDALRQIRAGHPWVYRDSITRQPSRVGNTGDLAVIFDDRRRFVAIGLFDPGSPIAVRILHHGRPRSIDRSWLEAIMARAVTRRSPLVDDPETTAYRLIHGENDGLPGLVVDYYQGSVVVKLYTAAWWPWLPTITEALKIVVSNPVTKRAAVKASAELERVVLRLSREVGGRPRRAAMDERDGQVLVGAALTGPVEFREHGLRLRADLARGHKTGYFLDQRENRALVADRAAGCSVLDVFAYTGGFSVQAAAAGAESVTSVDLSGPALEAARVNMALNGERTGGCRHRVMVGDAFAVMKRLAERGETFDVVIVDPPAFAQRARQVERALVGYRRLARLAAELVAPGGVLFQSSCSTRINVEQFQNAVRSGVAGAGRSFQPLALTGHPLDHPVGFAFGHYLKGWLVALDH